MIGGVTEIFSEDITKKLVRKEKQIYSMTVMLHMAE